MEDWAGKQHVWGEINCWELVINKTGLMEDHPKDTHINKELSTRQDGGDTFILLIGHQLSQQDISLKCFYITVHSMENKRGLCRWLQCHDMMGVTGTWWKDNHNWRDGSLIYGLDLCVRKDRLEG